MTDEIAIPAEAPAASGISDVKIETNYESAPVEQQSTEAVPVTEAPAEVAVAPAAEAPKATEDQSVIAAREAIQNRLRAEDAERRLREMQPKAVAPSNQPDINDQKSWGEKYKDAPNDLETFLKAHADWAEERGRSAERDAAIQAKTQQEQLALRTEFTRRAQESRAKHTDFDSVMTQVVPVLDRVPVIQGFIARHPMGTEVAYELGKNPQFIQDIMQSQSIWEAGEKLINMAARLKAPKPVEITKAPEPITPVGNRETIRPKIAELAAKDVGAYIKQQNSKELVAKRRPH